MKIYPLFKVHISTEEAISNIKDVFESGFINEGEQVTKLTYELQRILDVKNIVLTNSCTSAITLALRLSGIEQGDDVVSTPMTCVATNTPITTSGANIVWADVDPDSGMATSKTIEQAITSETKAVIVVAWAGSPPDLKGIQRICKKHNVAFILDAAHAFGARYNGNPIHGYADFTCYSFQAIKHFTTGDGGALVCAGTGDYKLSKSLKWFGLDRDHAKDAKGDWKGQQWDVDIEQAGYKFNMNNVSAAIGLSQIPHIERILKAHRANAEKYDSLFSSFNAAVPAKRSDACESSSWVYTMKIVTNNSMITRDELLKRLNSEGIMAGVVHVPNDEYTAFESSKKDLPGVREFSRNQFSLPCGWWLTSEDVEHIACRVKELLNEA